MNTITISPKTRTALGVISAAAACYVAACSSDSSSVIYPTSGAAGELGMGGDPSTGGVAAAGAAGRGVASGAPSNAGNAAVAGSISAAGRANNAGSPGAGGSGGTAASANVAGANALLPGPWNFTSSIEDWNAASPGTSEFSNTDPYCAGSGCLKISGDLTASPAYRVRIVLPQTYDLSGASIVVQIKWDSATMLGFVQAYAQDDETVIAGDDNWASSVSRGSMGALGAGATLNLNLPTSKVTVDTDLSSDVGTGTAKAGFNPARVFVIGINVGASATGGVSTFYVDSVTVTKP